MKNKYIFGIAILIVLILSTLLVFAAFHQPAKAAADTNTLAMHSKIILAQTGTNVSEVGSTTGIVFMGIAITMIVTVPLLIRKKRR